MNALDILFIEEFLVFLNEDVPILRQETVRMREVGFEPKRRRELGVGSQLVLVNEGVLVAEKDDVLEQNVSREKNFVQEEVVERSLGKRTEVDD